MSDISCSYTGDREQSLIAYLYDEIEPAERARFSAHLSGCERCRRDLAALGGVRQQLARWSPPEPAFVRQPPSASSDESSAVGRKSSFARQEPSAARRARRAVPVWVQVAAAVLIAGVSAAIANLDVRYDSTGVSVRTGWSKRPSAPPAMADSATHADLTALADQLRTEMRAIPASTAPPVRASVADAEVIRRVRGLIDESEKREQRELALRVAQVLRDVNVQRQVDLSNIDRNLGVIQNRTGVEILKQREMVNYLMRVSQRQ